MQTTGKPNVRMIDVARLAGVSRATVGMVLHGTGSSRIRVGQETSARIKQIAREMEYRPNLAARQLAGKRSKIIGLMMDPLPTEANSVRLAAIDTRCREAGYHLMTLHEQPQPELVKECLDEFVARGIDGLVCLHHCYPGNPELVPRLVSSRLENVVFFDRPPIRELPYVGPDYAGCTRLAVNYLLGRGYRRLGFVVADLQWYSGPRLKEGFLTQMTKHGQTVDDGQVWVGHQNAFSDLTQLSPETADQVIDDMVVREKVDALVFAEDYWAARVMNRLQDRGYRIPGDVAVVGQGDKHIAEYLRPRLTTIKPMLAEAGTCAVDMLITKIEGGDISGQSKFLRPELVERESA